MLPTVNLEYKFPRSANEVCNELSDGHLSGKLNALQTAIP